MIGLRLALEAKTRRPGARVLLIDKEPAFGRHASSRNSGVLHAGFYYSAESLKARFTREGNRALTEYCESRGIPVRRCGKLVVARDESELAGLDELLRRGRANGVELEELPESDVARIEPRARTWERCLFSPTTSSVDPARVVDAFVADAAAAGVDLRSGTAYLGRDRAGVRTTGGPISAGYVINAAGLHADRIARDFGCGEGYAILPFRGRYLYGEGARDLLRTHIYPVPDLRQPFLGVHFTVTAAGDVKIGPTATPALWREQYGLLRNFRPGELADSIRRVARLLVAGPPGFRALARQEIRKQFRRHLRSVADTLVRDPLPARWRWGPPGIRAQLLDVPTGELVMDFRSEAGPDSFHVLNAVSPGFTCSIPFAAYLFDRVELALAGT